MSRRPKNIVVNAGSIELMFSKAPTEPLKKETKKCEATEKTLKSDDPLVQAFYDQLNPAEIIAHTIAVEKLGTSYDVVRTHGFIRWSKARAAATNGSGGGK
jgi:hypothetical protein